MLQYEMLQSTVVILLMMILGDYLSKKMKAILPSILVTGVLYMILIWIGVLPKELVQNSGLSVLTPVSMGMIIIGMGASTNFKELKDNIRVVGLSALVYVIQVICILSLMTVLYDSNMAIGSIPGGSNVALIIQARAREFDYENIIVLSVLLISFKGLVSSPIVSIMVKREVRRLLSGDLLQVKNPIENEISESNYDIHNEKDIKDNRKWPKKGPCPKEEPFYVTLLRLYVVLWLGSRLEMLTGLSRYVFCLFLGVLFTEVGFLHKDDMDHIGLRKFFMFSMMAGIMTGFANATPQMLRDLCVPLLIVLGCDVLSVLISSCLFAKMFGFSKELACACGLQGMMGFPLNLMISQDIIDSMTENDDYKEVLNSKVSTQLILAGFTSTTVLSVVFAGILVGFMH